MNSSLSRQRPSVVTKQEFDALPKQGPDFLLDTAAIQKRLDARKGSPLRKCRCVFRVPQGASQHAFQEEYKKTIGRWLQWLESEGLVLHSDVAIFGPRPLRDDNTGAVILGEQEYICQAVFRHTRTAKPLRVELNPATVKRDPEHRLTLKEAIKAWGLPPRTLREGRS